MNARELAAALLALPDPDLPVDMEGCDCYGAATWVTVREESGDSYVLILRPVSDGGSGPEDGPGGVEAWQQEQAHAEASPRFIAERLEQGHETSLHWPHDHVYAEGIRRCLWPGCQKREGAS